MLVERSFSITNPSGDSISGDVRFLDDPAKKAVIVVCHGFTAFKDWGPFPHFGREFARLGFVSVVFNFSHNGIAPGKKKFSEFEKFSRNTIGKELEDVRAVVDAVAEGRVAEESADVTSIGIVGHSRGGGIALLSASNDPRIRAAAGWSTVATFQRYTDHQQQLWEREGYLPVSLKASRTRLRFGLEVLRDLQANKDRYDIHAAVRRLRIPLLLVHGAEDVSVKLREPESLYDVSDKARTQLVVLEHVGHIYGAKHPFGETNPAIEHIIGLTARWFHSHLQE